MSTYLTQLFQVLYTRCCDDTNPVIDLQFCHAAFAWDATKCTLTGSYAFPSNELRTASWTIVVTSSLNSGKSKQLDGGIVFRTFLGCQGSLEIFRGSLILDCNRTNPEYR
jgi:hypothetical protein